MSSKSKKQNSTTPSLPPIALNLRSRYPSYQLYATAGAPSLEGEQLKDVFKRCVLRTYDWLRDRFVNYDIPELNFPEPNKAAKVRMEDFRTFSVSEPYGLEIVSLPDDCVWAMRLTEPDKGSAQKTFNSGKPIVH